MFDRSKEDEEENMENHQNKKENKYQERKDLLNAMPRASRLAGRRQRPHFFNLTFPPVSTFLISPFSPAH